jgi:hypothetical protein
MRESFEKWSSFFDEREVDRYLYLMSNFAVIPASRQVVVTVSISTETFRRNISRRQNSVFPSSANLADMVGKSIPNSACGKHTCILFWNFYYFIGSVKENLTQSSRGAGTLRGSKNYNTHTGTPIFPIQCCPPSDLCHTSSQGHLNITEHIFLPFLR